MKPERWQQIEQLYHSALKREAGQRTTFLAEARADDDSLRREVESLLAHAIQAENIIEMSILRNVVALVRPYEEQPAACHDYDPRAAQVATHIAEVINQHLPNLLVEHVGSTSVPGCAGKGVVDLMLLYPPGQLEAAKALLDQLGFQRQSTRDPWPETRPMRVGAYEYDGKLFRLHAHVIAMDSPEVAELRAFRDRLRNDPALLAAYVERKRQIIAAGVTDTVDYSLHKGDFVGAVLEGAIEL